MSMPVSDRFVKATLPVSPPSTPEVLLKKFTEDDENCKQITPKIQMGNNKNRGNIKNKGTNIKKEKHDQPTNNNNTRSINEHNNISETIST